VHSLAQAVAALKAALRAGRPVTLLSAADAGINAGAGWFAALVAAALAEAPGATCATVLDCGDDPAAALVALRQGIERVVFTGREDVAARLADIAGQYGVRLERERPRADLDLEADFLASDAVLEARCAGIF
jgi:acyl-CoA reductase-like NAD-dependent aldehyde dehydrogenase